MLCCNRRPVRVSVYPPLAPTHTRLPQLPLIPTPLTRLSVSHPPPHCRLSASPDRLDSRRPTPNRQPSLWLAALAPLPSVHATGHSHFKRKGRVSECASSWGRCRGVVCQPGPREAPLWGQRAIEQRGRIMSRVNQFEYVCAKFVRYNL